MEENKFSEQDRQRAYTWAKALCEYAGKDEKFLETFFADLLKSPELFEEFLYYLEHQDFLCKKEVCGITVTDILVWQIDRFKAGLDDFDKRDMKYNADKMLLMAFHTMLDVEKHPENYTEHFRTETGTDYAGKY